MINLRNAELGDAQQISEMIQGNFLGRYYEHLTPAERKLYVSANSEKNISGKIVDETSKMFVAENTASLCGVLLLNFDNTRGANGGWRIRRLHTHPDYARLGLADRLLDMAYMQTIRGGHTKLYAEPTAEVERFFRERGWQGYLTKKLSSMTLDDGTIYTTTIKKMIARKNLRGLC